MCLRRGIIFDMTICPVQPFDIPAIMKIERAAFIPQIQDKQKVFEARLRAFPQGFFALLDNSPAAVMKNGYSVVAGYFCGEMRACVPQSDDFVCRTTGRQVLKSHVPGGGALYVSSFALHSEYKERKLAKPFLEGSLESLCVSFKNIKVVFLLVSDEWKAALRVCESLGFSSARVVRGAFPSLRKVGTDGMLMSCPADVFRNRSASEIEPFFPRGDARLDEAR